MLYIHAECMILIKLMKIMAFLEPSVHCKIKIKLKMLQKTWFFKILLNDFRSVFEKFIKNHEICVFLSKTLSNLRRNTPSRPFFGLFLKKYKKWKHTYKPSLFAWFWRFFVFEVAVVTRKYMFWKNFFENTVRIQTI